MKTDLRLAGDRLFVKAPYSPALVARFGAIPGRAFEGGTKEWSFPCAPDTVSMVCDVLGVLPDFLPDDVRRAAGLGGGCPVERVALDLSVLDGFHFVTEPYAHQRRNLARLICNDRWLLADCMGTGKSKAVVDRVRYEEMMQRSQDLPGYFHCLVVCPKTVVPGWVEQLQTHGGPYQGAAFDRPLPDVMDRRPVVVTNYEQVQRHPEVFLDPARGWTMLVLDEVHRLKDFTAKTSRLLRQISAGCKHVYGLSGTPFPNGLEDALGVLSVIDPDLLPVKTKTAFAARYLVKSNLPGTKVWVVSGYRNVAELHRHVARVCSRTTKAECLDLPPKVYENRVVALAGEQARVYRELKKDAVARLKSPAATHNKGYGDGPQLTVRNVLTESLRLLQVVGGFAPDDDGVPHALDGNAKLEALRDLLDDLPPDEPLVVWCAFRAEAECLVRVLGERGPAVKLTGAETPPERQEALDAFRTGRARFFVGTSAGGEGVNGLQERCNTEVFFSRNWNLKDYLQQQDRLHRIGQGRPVTVIHLVARGTVDEKVAQALETKAGLQDLLLTDPEKLF